MNQQQIYQFLRTIDKGVTLDKVIAVMNSSTLSDNQKADKIWQMVVEEIMKQFLDHYTTNGGQQ